MGMFSCFAPPCLLLFCFGIVPHTAAQPFKICASPEIAEECLYSSGFFIFLCFTIPLICNWYIFHIISYVTMRQCTLFRSLTRCKKRFKANPYGWLQVIEQGFADLLSFASDSRRGGDERIG